MEEENINNKETEKQKKRGSSFFKVLGILFISLILATFTIVVINL